MPLDAASLGFLDWPGCSSLYDSTWQNVSIVALAGFIPVALFVCYLLWFLQDSLRKLRQSESLIMSTYYGFLWSVCIFNAVRCLFNVMALYDPRLVDQLVFLMFSSAVIFLEVAVVVFMAHGNAVTGREAIRKTMQISGTAGSVFFSVEVVLMFGLGVPLHSFSGYSSLFWFISSFLFAVAYLVILILPKTSIASDIFHVVRPTFYHYVGFLLALYVLLAIGSIFIFVGLDSGYCITMTSSFAYNAFYAPILYICFLRDFFKDVQVSEPLLEMHLGGYADSDS